MLDEFLEVAKRPKFRRFFSAADIEEILETIKQHISLEIVPRSTRLRSSSISIDHPVIKCGVAMGKKTYGSPTTSDKALMPLPSLKCGPGFSGQSHSADEFVAVKDIEDGVRFYTELLSKLFNTMDNG